MQIQEFNQLVLDIKDKMYRLALRIVKDNEEARDVVQDTFIKIWVKRNKLDEVDNKEAYIMAMTRNMAIDKYRSKRMDISDIDEQFGLQSDAANPERLVVIKEAYQKVHRVIDSLPENHKTVIQLRDIEGYSYKEICDETGYSLEQVKVYLHRARIKLKEQVKSNIL